MSGFFPLQLDRVSATGDLASLRRHLRQNFPILIDDLMAGSPALRLTPSDLASRYGDKVVPVYDASFGEPGENYMGSIASMTLAEFLDQLFRGRDLRMFLYNLARHVPELVDDLTLPDTGLRFSRRFIFSFFGCKGVTTPLHYDIDMGCVLHTAVYGRRRVRLFAPDQSVALGRHPFTVRSYANLDDPDLEAFPALGSVRGYEVVIEPGQTLFMPAGYWHEFHYLDPGFGISQRAASPRLSDRIQGVANLTLSSPLDRLINKLAPDAWYGWKQRTARSRAFSQERRHA